MLKSKPQKQLKIAIMAISFGKGGLERAACLLSDMLTARGFAVTNIILTDRIDYTYSGDLFNLGKFKKNPDKPIARFKRFRKLRKFLEEEQFDLIIDHRPRNEWKRELFYLNYVYKNLSMVYVIHNYMTWNYMTEKKWVAQKIIDKTSGLVGVSQAITDKLTEEFSSISIETIYNPIEDIQLKPPKHTNLPEKYMLFLGRLDSEIKNIPLLLKAYQRSKQKYPLVLMGAGNKTAIKKEIKTLQLEKNVRVLEYDAHVGYYLKNAEFLALTSKFEGFPMVLLEALSVGTPVVSVNCKSGPDEVIQHEKNGLLVENYNLDALTKALNRMSSDEKLRNQCKAFARESVEHLHQENIALQWEKYILSILEEKK